MHTHMNRDFFFIYFFLVDITPKFGVLHLGMASLRGSVVIFGMSGQKRITDYDVGSWRISNYSIQIWGTVAFRKKSG